MNATDNSGSKALIWALLGALLLAGLVIAFVVFRPAGQVKGPEAGSGGEVLRVDQEIGRAHV